MFPCIRSSFANSHFWRFAMKCTNFPPCWTKAPYRSYRRSNWAKSHLCTAIRWVRNGRRGIKLRSWYVNNRRLTTVEAVCEFVNGVTDARDGATAYLSRNRVPKHPEKKAADKARKQLDPRNLVPKTRRAGSPSQLFSISFSRSPNPRPQRHLTEYTKQSIRVKTP